MKERDVTDHAKQRLFTAILDRQAPWKGLTSATFAVATGYIVTLCAVVLLSSPAAAPAKRQPRSLVVTLFDAAKLTRRRLLDDTGGAAPGATGASAAAGPMVGASAAPDATPKQRAAPDAPTPRSKPQPRAHSAPESNPKDVRGAAAKVEPEIPAPSPAIQAPVVSAQSAAATPGPAVNAGAPSGAAGGFDTTTHGTGSGSGSGVGSGTRAGVASGDTTVLPFMDGMTRPSVISKVDPEYTREARDANVQGLILTKCVITSAGRLRNCRIVKGVPMMDQAVLRALSQWRYTPVLYQGKPVDVEYVIPVRLVLQ